MSQMADTSIRDILDTGYTLLQPPAPLPSAPPLLLERLRHSAQHVSWRDKPAWNEDDELDVIALDDDSSNPARVKKRRDELVLVVGKRSIDLVVALQWWLSKEFWPVNLREGLNEKDFLLGTADLRLVRLLLSHSMASGVLPLITAYIGGLRQRAPVDPSLLSALSSLVGLIETPLPAATSSERNPIPPTTITQTVVAAHLPLLILAAVTLAWTPTARPETYAALRQQLISSLNSLSPTQAMASLGTSLKIVQASKKAGKTTPTRSQIIWPGYVAGAVSTLMSAQVQRSGGVKAVMENVFGEAGNMAGPEAVEGQKLDQVAELLARVPKNVPEQMYIPGLLNTLMDLVAPESGNHPIVYTHAAAYVIHHLWSTSSLAVEWLNGRLHPLWLPVNPAQGVVVPASAVSAAARTMALLVLHAPPSPLFVDFVVRPIILPLFALYASLTPKIQAKSIEKRSESAPGLVDDARLLLTSWGKVVPKDEGVKGIWSVVTGGKGWPASPEGLQVQWRKGADGVELVNDYPMVEHQEISATMEDDEAMLDQFDLSPDPPTLSQLLKDFDQPEISSEVFLKVLDEWRVRANAADQDPLSSLLFLRLTLAMMETLGEKLLSNPDHVLNFVEGVLNDEVQTIAAKKHSLADGVASMKLVEEVDEDINIDEPLPELTPEGIEKMGMVETAISLLLASLEANDKLNHTTTAILHPINDHLETLSSAGPTNVRQLAREALLVLLVRRSASLTSEDGQVSHAVATYRRALTLVQDPILPVRAHGLVLLRDLVLSKEYEPALTPGIMEVYMGSIQDKDSYIYLNAVKGLAAMADALGKDIFRTLVRMYRTGNVELDNLDKRLRIGEALGMVIRSAGKAFVANAEFVVPALLSMFPDTSLPTILRTSSLSLLSTCAEVDHLALLPWANELTSAAIDLVQIESVVSSPFRPEAVKEEEPVAPARPKIVLVDDDEPEEEVAKEQTPRIVDEEPTAQDSKHPALRRAAVVFLGLLTASLIEAASPEQPPASDEFKLRLPNSSSQLQTRQSHARCTVTLQTPVLDRAANVLGYVAATDVDEVVRGQAGEVVALVQRLKSVQQLSSLSSRQLL